MLYFHTEPSKTFAGCIKLIAVSTESGPDALCRWDFRHWADAESMAANATAVTGRLHIATDSGPHVSPRFDVIEAPKVGDMVSRNFNGDSYPAGQIVKISKSLARVQTDTGVVFYRRKLSGNWKSESTWSMIQGHHSELNPSF